MAPTYRGLVLGISQIKINAKKFRIIKKCTAILKITEDARFPKGLPSSHELVFLIFSPDFKK